MKRETAITQIVKSGSIQLFITIAGLLVTLLNVYVSSKLAPIARDLFILTERVNAAEIEHASFATKDEIMPMKEDIKEIKGDIKTLLQMRNK